MNESQRDIESRLASFYELESATRDLRRPVGHRVEYSDRALAEVMPEPPSMVLDLGAGPGTDSRTLVAAGYAVTALDLAVENAKRCVGYGAPGVVGSVTNLAFADRSFEAVWSLSVLMHVGDEAIAGSLCEIRRVMRPGAIAVIGTWGGDDATLELESSEFGMTRHFRHRSDEVWRQLLSENLGTIEYFEAWPNPDHVDWHYQWAHVRAA